METKLFTHYYAVFSSSSFARRDVFEDNHLEDRKTANANILCEFARTLVTSIGMTEFMAPIAGLSTGVNEAWTVFIGLHESCITMHIYPWEQLEINVSSCKAMTAEEMKATQKLVTRFWQMKECDLIAYSKTPGTLCKDFKEEQITVLDAN